MIAMLAPLTTHARPRELLVQTANPDWTAYFDCGADGTDGVSFVGHLTRTLKCRGVIVSSIPHTFGTKLEQPGRLGAVQFELLGPEDTEFLNYVRTISVTHDGSRWQFEAGGTIQDFEDISHYSARRIKDRFTSDVLNQYCQALGLSPFDPVFYGAKGSLVEVEIVLSADALSLSLERAQQRIGVKPGISSRVNG
ncbi:hypothetical protein ACIBSW_25085 [Actinoplanes sp. NPDC049668]|uniref:hypothetical protein n=1 Tax=unclassified Actinoplanes TaxID=2626549 RepID=UPI0033AD765B